MPLTTSALSCLQMIEGPGVVLNEENSSHLSTPATAVTSVEGSILIYIYMYIYDNRFIW